MKHVLKFATVVGLVMTAASAQAAAPAAKPEPKLKGQELAASAKITMEAAKATALKARPGKITDSELEKEAGGSGLRYSFDIKVGKATYEVGVDAQTGAVLENAKEGKNPD